MSILSGISLLSDLTEEEIKNFSLFCQEKRIPA